MLMLHKLFIYNLNVGCRAAGFYLLAESAPKTCTWALPRLPSNRFQTIWVAAGVGAHYGAQLIKQPAVKLD